MAKSDNQKQIRIDVQPTVKSIEELNKEIQEFSDEMAELARKTEEYNKALKESRKAMPLVTRLTEGSNEAAKELVKNYGELTGSFEKAVKGYESVIKTAKLIGIENKALVSSFDKLNTALEVSKKLQAFAEGIDVTKLATEALGDVADKVKDWTTKLEPFIKNLDDYITVAGQSLTGLSTAITGLAGGPVNALNKAIKGDFKGAINEFKNGFNVVKNFREGYNWTKPVEEKEEEEEEVADAEKQIEKNEELAESEKKLAEGRKEIERSVCHSQGFDPDATREEIEEIKQQEAENEIKRIEDIADATREAAEEKLENLEELAEAEKELTELEEEKTEAEEEANEVNKNIAEERIQAAREVANSVIEAFGEQSVAGKAAAIAMATIDTYKAANSAYAALAGIPIVGPALGAAAAAAAIAAGIANMKKIASTKTPGDGDASGGGATPSVPLAPDVDIPSFPEAIEPIRETHNNLNGYEEEMLNQPQKVYVLESDISSTQSRVNVVENKATH